MNRSMQSSQWSCSRFSNILPLLEHHKDVFCSSCTARQLSIGSKWRGFIISIFITLEMGKKSEKQCKIEAQKEKENRATKGDYIMTILHSADRKSTTLETFKYIHIEITAFFISSEHSTVLMMLLALFFLDSNANIPFYCCDEGLPKVSS